MCGLRQLFDVTQDAQINPAHTSLINQVTRRTAVVSSFIVRSCLGEESVMQKVDDSHLE